MAIGHPNGEVPNLRALARNIQRQARQGGGARFEAGFAPVDVVYASGLTSAVRALLAFRSPSAESGAALHNTPIGPASTKGAKPPQRSRTIHLGKRLPKLTTSRGREDARRVRANLPLPFCMRFRCVADCSNLRSLNQIKKGNHVSTAPTVCDHVAIRFHLSLFQRSLRGIPIPRHVDHDSTSGVPV